MIDPAAMSAARSGAGAAAKLAAAAGATRWRELPEAVREHAAGLFLDTLAVIAAGSRHPVHRAWARTHASGTGRATLVGRSSPAAASIAALSNGGATTVLQLQDGHREARGHPASHVMPVALAIAEEIDASSDALFSAFVAGCEVAIRAGVALGGLQPDLHDTATWGTLGGAVAASHLLSAGDPARIAAAIDGAAGLALLPQREAVLAGASLHHLNVGLAGVAAITFAEAVQAGLTCVPGTLESFFGPRAGARFVPEALTRDIGSDGRWQRHRIVEGYIKRHPSCAHTHGALDAMEELIARHSLAAPQVASIDVGVYAAALEFDVHSPASDLAARFSLRTLLALMLRDGALPLGEIAQADLRDAALREISSRIEVRHVPELDAQYPAGRPTVVTVRCRDGRELVGRVTDVKGDDRKPLSAAERRDKAARLLTHAFDEPGARSVLEAFDALVQGGSVADLSHALRENCRELERS